MGAPDSLGSMDGILVLSRSVVDVMAVVMVEVVLVVLEEASPDSPLSFPLIYLVERENSCLSVGVGEEESFEVVG